MYACNDFYCTKKAVVMSIINEPELNYNSEVVVQGQGQNSKKL